MKIKAKEIKEPNQENTREKREAKREEPPFKASLVVLIRMGLSYLTKD